MRRKPSKDALLLSPAAAARRLGIDVRLIRTAIERKQIPSVELSNRRYIPTAALDRLLDN